MKLKQNDLSQSNNWPSLNRKKIAGSLVNKGFSFWIKEKRFWLGDEIFCGILQKDTKRISHDKSINKIK